MNAHTKLLNAFIPSRSMNDPDRFAGRAKQVKDLANAINIDGSVPLIYGERGLGKSSIAVQMHRIAQGNNALLQHLSAEDMALPKEKQAIAFYVTCQDSTNGLDGLLSAMINAMERLQYEEAMPKKGRRSATYRLVDRTTRTAVSLKIFSHERVKSYQNATQDRDFSLLSLPERLVEQAESLTSSYGQPVLFIIDELDRLKGVDGLASFLKANSSPVLKFILVGIGVTEAELLNDHRSLGRQLVSVKIPTMVKGELESIVHRTEDFLRDNNLDYNFSADATSELAAIADGFPWFVHIIGQKSLIEAKNAGQRQIQKVDIESAVTLLGEGQMAQTYFDSYQKAVQDSAPREIVLRLFAKWPESTIPTSDVYAIAATLGVKGAPTYAGHLRNDQYGNVLARPPIQKRALYYFTDPMFKAYVNMRPSIYDQIDESVRSATVHWQARRGPSVS